MTPMVDRAVLEMSEFFFVMMKLGRLIIRVMVTLKFDRPLYECVGRTYRDIHGLANQRHGGLRAPRMSTRSTAKPSRSK